MAARTAAQEEFDTIISKASASERLSHHPSDLSDYKHDRDHGEQDEDDEYRQRRIEENMRMPAPNHSDDIHLPHRDFDSGRTTGVKGVIADARSFQDARRSSSWKSRIIRGVSGSRASVVGKSSSSEKENTEGSASEDEEFIERWRQSRREELVREGSDIRNRRTSPSVRRYGRFDEVDAMGYLDAIEKVTRDTIVVVLVEDPESAVSQVISEALEPLVPTHPAIHFVRVHYDDIEFDPAAVPAVLGYKNQGDLFANLTYIIGLIPDDTFFDTSALVTILKQHQIL